MADIILLVVLVIVAGIVIVLKFSHKYNRNEYILAGIIAVIVAGGGGAYSLYGDTVATEILSGSVTGKDQESVICSHTYDCNCRMETSCSGSGKDRTCSSRRVCDTCREHPHDYNWVVYSDVGDSSKIDRIDRQGVDMPPRFASVKVGDPYSTTHTYLNYIKGSHQTILKNEYDGAYTAMIPEYPGTLYDYYRINRALSAGVNVPDLANWSSDISIAMRTLGPSKQANLIILFAGTNDPKFAYAVDDKWVGGNKNDVIVIMGSKEYPKIDFVRVLALSSSENVKINIRDRLEGLGTIDRTSVMGIITDEIQRNFRRQSMKEFEYLMAEHGADSYWFFGLLILSVLILFSPKMIEYANKPRFKHRRR